VSINSDDAVTVVLLTRLGRNDYLKAFSKNCKRIQSKKNRKRFLRWSRYTPRKAGEPEQATYDSL